MNKTNWTTEEDEYIKSNFKNKTFSEMAKHFGCAILTVQNRAEFLGFEFEKKTIPRWTEEEIELLKIMAPKYLNKTIAKKLNRSVKGLNKKARELGIQLIFKNPVWEEWKVNFLKENINRLSLSQIRKRLEVSYYQIVDKLDELGIEYNTNFWSEEEISILTELSDKVYVREIAKILNRTEDAILDKAIQMGLNYITLRKVYKEEELQYIKDNWRIIPINEMARNLGVSSVMIKTQADKMNLPKLGNNPYKKWTKNNLAKLRRLAPQKSITELAKVFNTTNNAIKEIARKNGIPLNKDRMYWTKEEIAVLKELAKTLDTAEIAIKMNRSPGAIRTQAERQKIKLIPKEGIWTSEHTRQLKKLVHENKSLLEICNIMNKKDVMVLNKAKELKLDIKLEKSRDWSNEEKNKLRELSQTKKMSELVQELNRTSCSIKAMAKKLGIHVMSDRKNWTKEECKLLEKLAMIDKKTPKEIAKILGRTEDAINIKINKMGLQIPTKTKRVWTKEEDTLLSDLWGTESYEVIAKKLNRTANSIKDRAFHLGLGSVRENNYNGLTIKEISDIFGVNINTVNVGWIGLGLKYKVQKISKSKSYRYVEIKDLYEFLEANQNIWDSRNLEKNILGIEPDWLKEKRKLDREQKTDEKRLNIMKQQLVLAKQYFLDLEQFKETTETSEEVMVPKLAKRKK